jgi:LacI family transcriptional regulator
MQADQQADMSSKIKDQGIKPASGISAIAATLGISVATVHRALHNQGRISEKTRARVLRMADQMAYRPNLAARDLRLNRHFRISVHLPATIAAFFDALRAGIEEGAAPFRSALDLEFHTYMRVPGQAEKSIQAALDAEVGGIITVPANTAEMAALVRAARNKRIPILCVSTDAPESGRLTAVTAHPLSCGAMAAEVLAGNMKRRSRAIVLAGDLVNLNQSEKVRGFRTMLAQAATTLSIAAVFETHDDPRLAAEGIRRLLKSVADVGGIYVSSANSLAPLAVLAEMGLLGKVPVVTTDLFPELVPFLRDGLVQATVYQCPELQGSLAIRVLYRYLMEGEAPPPSINVIPQLVMRSNLDLYLHEPPSA